MAEEQKTKCVCKKVWFWIALGVVIVLAVGGYFYYQYTFVTCALPSCYNNIQKSNIVVEDLGNGNKLVKNVEDNIQLEIVQGWNVTEHPEEALNVLYRGDEQPKVDTDLADGVNLSVNELSSGDNLDIRKWLVENSQYGQLEVDKMEKISINGLDVLVIKQDFDDNGYLPVGFVNKRFDYMVVKNNRLIDYSCDIISKLSQIDFYTRKCLDILKNNL